MVLWEYVRAWVNSCWHLSSSNRYWILGTSIWDSHEYHEIRDGGPLASPAAYLPVCDVHAAPSALIHMLTRSAMSRAQRYLRPIDYGLLASKGAYLKDVGTIMTWVWG